GGINKKKNKGGRDLKSKNAEVASGAQKIKKNGALYIRTKKKGGKKKKKGGGRAPPAERGGC
ncbi:hypothetical protein, partial [Enterobacter roggenkampii]